MSDRKKACLLAVAGAIVLLVLPFVICTLVNGATDLLLMYYAIVFFLLIAAAFFMVAAMTKRLEKLEREMKIQLAALAFTLSELKNKPEDGKSTSKTDKN